MLRGLFNSLSAYYIKLRKLPLFTLQDQLASQKAIFIFKTSICQLNSNFSFYIIIITQFPNSIIINSSINEFHNNTFNETRKLNIPFPVSLLTSIKKLKITPF